MEHSLLFSIVVVNSTLYKSMLITETAKHKSAERSDGKKKHGLPWLFPELHGIFVGASISDGNSIGLMRYDLYLFLIIINWSQFHHYNRNRNTEQVESIITKHIIIFEKKSLKNLSESILGDGVLGTKHSNNNRRKHTRLLQSK